MDFGLTWTQATRFYTKSIFNGSGLGQEEKCVVEGQNDGIGILCVYDQEGVNANEIELQA